MAASQEQKVDYLLKKIGYVSSKTGIAEDSNLSGTKKAPFAEPIPSPLVIPSSNVWSDSTLIPTTPPGSSNATVQVYLSGTSGHQMTMDPTVSGNRTFLAYSTYNNTSSAMLGNWIDPSFGSNYMIKVYKGDPNSGGVQLSAAGSGSNDTWFFDYSSGVLNFNGTVVPAGITTNNIYLVGYRYIGGTGIQGTGGITTATSINVSGISTFGNIRIQGNEIDTTTGGLTLDSTSGTVTVDDDLKVVGLLTAANAYIVGNLTVEGTTTTLNTNLTEVDRLEVGANNTTVGAAITQSGTGDILNLYDGNTEVFSVEDGGRIVGTATSSVIPFLHASHAALPSAGSYHGAFAHAHAEGKAYYAHAAAWYELVNRNQDGTIGVTSDRYHVGFITASNLSVGVATVTTTLDVDGQTEVDDLNVAGIATFKGDVQFHGSAGVTSVFFDSSSKTLTFNDDARAGFGNGNDVQLYYNPANDIFYIYNNSANGGTVIQNNSAAGGITLQPVPNENAVFCSPNGSVRIYHNNSEKFRTTGLGVTVFGTTQTQTLNVSGISTLSGDVYLGARVSAGGTFGSNGKILQSTGVGVTWVNQPATRTTSIITATEDQTTFNFNYNVGFLDVFYNGVKLASSEFTATNGTSVVLNDVAYAGDLVELISYGTITAGSGGGGGGAGSLNELTDVTITGTPAVGEILQHDGMKFVNDFTTTQTTTSQTQITLLSLDVSVYRSVEYTVQISRGVNHTVTKVLAIHDGSNASHTEYGTLQTGSMLSTLDVDVNGSNLRLRATSSSTNSTVYKVKFTGIKA